MITLILIYFISAFCITLNKVYVKWYDLTSAELIICLIPVVNTYYLLTLIYKGIKNTNYTKLFKEIIEILKK